MKALLLALVCVIPAHAAAAPLDGYQAYARKALADWKVPGAAIAVVKDGRVDTLARRPPDPPPPRPPAPPVTLPLDRYAGTYSQDLLGDVVVTATRTGLSLRFGRALAGEAEPWGQGSFRIHWANPEYGTDLVVFQLDAAGQPTRLVVDGLG